MEPAFWHKRWADNQIGFHQPQVNSDLIRNWPTLPAASRVFVPLCGKSQDMAWLAGQGYRILGVELSRKAVEAFFDEHQRVAEVERRGVFEVWRSGPIELWCGDVFALQPQDLADCAAVYDRAALIALPEALRKRYLELLCACLPHHCQGLLITLEYDQSRVEGPPFSVTETEVRAGLGAWEITELQAPETLDSSPKFQAAGVPSLIERVYRLERPGH
ncbi:thiopurine S-methyltransferase [Pseudomonas sp. S75]|uniref:thiopurine S-methyltransferase n=1 Tax=unclassified Pseudomonas TaxID=196821 RepID=UPI001905FD57|nr:MULTISPECIES: thiopurine S-methyltransferase [unclassified Pseudomonas]MBJ9978262.1 thiopurine S-methyltransferase [Pseudomonas sp. S30]MBK0156144.1 thiopurine S-methyltransferase [Pseudomonas sp. S75]